MDNHPTDRPYCQEINSTAGAGLQLGWRMELALRSMSRMPRKPGDGQVVVQVSQVQEVDLWGHWASREGGRANNKADMHCPYGMERAAPLPLRQYKHPRMQIKQENETCVLEGLLASCEQIAAMPGGQVTRQEAAL